MSLFNPKTIEKNLGSYPFRATEQQIARATAWAEACASNKIRSIKETSLYGDFGRYILKEILGYTTVLDGDEYTAAENEPVAAGSVEFALGRFSASKRQVIAPFELKGANTDLDSIMPGRHKTPVQQAWDYATDAPGAEWVLVSNYIELRLYAFGYGRQRYESWELRQLNEPKELARLHLLLAAENLLSGKTRSLLEQSEREDEDITEKLYTKYKELRERLIEALGDQNKLASGEDAIRHAQKILDRVLFVAFAEDQELLPRDTLLRAFEARNPFAPAPIWGNFKGLFRQIDKGYRDPVDGRLSIPAYNGGLFAEDTELDALIVPDLICEGFRDLGGYDYESEVSVYILGHIFEQSITDIETLQAEARGEGAPRVTKKKREGVVYTPDFITRFIVEQTLGRYLQERFLELLKEYSHETTFPEPGQAVRWHKRANAERNFWRAYQQELLVVKLLDPACGSGAFLIAAFDFLDSEYTRVNRRLAEIAGEGMGTLFDPHKAILSGNLYGVDVNAESVEITKLSLWLRTAKRGQPLQSLRSNIRVGNSLIEDSDYHYRAFRWREAFPEIFEQGGFHIVIGNPPYVRMELIKPFKPYLERRYEVVSDRADLYSYFYELGFRLLRPGGKLGFISSSTFFRTGSGAPLRRFLSEKASIESVVDFGDTQIFGGVTTYPAIVTMTKPDAAKAGDETLEFLNVRPPLPQDLSVDFAKNSVRMPCSRLTVESWHFEDSSLAALRRKIRYGKKTLEELFGAPLNGIKTGLNAAFIISDEIRKQLIAADARSQEVIKPFLMGSEIKKWHIEAVNQWLIYMPKGRVDLDEFPAIENHLAGFRSELEKRAAVQDWFELQQSQYAYKKFFEGDKIVFRDISAEPTYSFLPGPMYLDMTAFFIPGQNFFLLAILNSKLAWFFWTGFTPILRGGFLRLKRQFVSPLPIPSLASGVRQKLSSLAEKAQRLCEERQTIVAAVRHRILDLSPDCQAKLSNRLKGWWVLDFSEFRAEIKSNFKSDIPLEERSDWESYLASSGEKVSLLSQAISNAETEIDQLVYEAYELTIDEIALLENSLLKA